ncbi:MAG: hypothetical protein KAS04_03870 [Candidatus Aenigmarchaeota archaeon]|nr:hypothetical protein [Candidatus Aenigmarchaeota archaeon]
MSFTEETTKTYFCDLCGEEIELKHPYKFKEKHICSKCFDELKEWIESYD